MLFATALAESNEIAGALEDLTPKEAAAAGAAVGAVIGIMAVMAVAWFILQVIADWKIFTKAGEPGWKSIIPIYNYYTEYKLCWNGGFGLVYGLLYVLLNALGKANTGTMPAWQSILIFVGLIAMCVLHSIESVKLAKAFRKSTGFGVFLFFFGAIGRLVLGFGSAKYRTRKSRRQRENKEL